ncbi:lipopolysaccharide biosynthesis protein [Novosphingobium mangrovi (ex Huang et al. 2023)]|uniref:Oligosaccharide flippase family protein n=1 Tax=Novosphingobium mangrovi (ex Huang et al. 2023) TaxID=2976432 RepID=A0ABT2I523_9SPHN|nr:oligosaccharide flippase family protein [Novosphingobium mangrovi (ex Huang et al. 2023)]MCT2399911.1 oligosaccharide flippase family protein [Novosphingobium mangrovi (ex Huang et al. 2023)]
MATDNSASIGKDADTAARTGRRPMWQSAVGALGSRAIDIPSRYGFHLIVAGKLGLVAAGAFYIVFSVITLVAGAGRLGVDRAMTREVARALARDEPARARRTIRNGMARVACLSALVACLMAALSGTIADRVFDNPALVWPLVLGAATIVPLCLSAAAGGALAGLHRIALSQMIYSWLWPALFCLCALPLSLDLNGIMLLLFGATSVAALVSFGLLLWFLPARSAEAESGMPTANLMTLGWSLFTTEIVQLLNAAMPALVLGVLSTQAAVGEYAMAWRLALILNLLVVAIAAMASPRFADQSARGDIEGLRATAAGSVGLVLALGLGPLVVLWIGAPVFLGLFGEGFVAATTTMRILLVGQFVLMLAAGSPELLGMSGHERTMQRINNLAIVLYLPALAGLAWTMSAEGAAVASILIAAVTAFGAVRLGVRYFGFVPVVALVRSLQSRRA